MTTGSSVATSEDAAAGDEPSAAQRAALEAVRAAEAAAEQAREAQRQAEERAERARRLAEEYQRLAEQSNTTQPTTADIADAPPDAEVADADADSDADEAVAASAAPSRVPVVTAAAALVAALAFAVVALVIHLTSSGGSGSAAATRDAVLLDAQQDIVVLNTLDYRSVDAGLKRWSAASTGTLHDSLAHVGAATRRHIVAARRITTAKVLDAAVVALDTQAGTATVIASVELHVAPAGGGPATIRRERLRAEMSRVGGTWKVASLSQVGVTVG